MAENNIVCTNPDCKKSENVIFSKKRNCYFCEDCNQDVIVVKPIIPLNIFLSYGRDQHIEFAEKVKNDLISRGHNVWFDKDRLKEGADWENYIEDGLRMVSANPSIGRFIYIITPHSARKPDGFCLNEISSVVMHNVNIIPVMLVLCELPLSICRIQWLDAQDCARNYSSAGYEKTLKRLLEALEEGKLDYEGVQSGLLNKLNPIDFGSDIFYHLKNFTGRRWLIDLIDQWLADDKGSKVFVLQGGPGVGKTAFSAYLIDQKKEIAAYHLCKTSDDKTNKPVNLVKSIAYQLSTQIKDYQYNLAQIEIDKDTDAITLFNQIIAQPLFRINNPGNKVFILIDALDEAISLSNMNEIATLIATVFNKTPDWLRMIVTTRPEPGVIELLQEFNPFVLNASSDENIRDIMEFLEENLKGHEKNVREKAIQSIIRKSEGNFLYITKICAEIEDPGNKLIDVEHPDKFPFGMGQLFMFSFQRKFGKCDYRKEIDPFLHVILAALEPVSIEYISSLLCVSETEVCDFLHKAGSLFPVIDDKIRPFHKSLVDWIHDQASSNIYVIRRNDVEKRMGELHFDLWNRMLENPEEMNDPNDYCARFALIHLYKAGMKKELQGILRDIFDQENEIHEIFIPGIEKLFDWVVENRNIKEEVILTSLLNKTQDEIQMPNLVRFRNFLNLRASKYNKGGQSNWALFIYEIVVKINTLLVRSEPENIDFKAALAMSINMTGVIYGELGDTKKALELCEQARADIELLTNLDTDRGELKAFIPVILLDLVRIYNQMGNTLKVIECYENAIEQTESLISLKLGPEETTLKPVLVTWYGKLKRIYIAIGNKDKAIELGEKIRKNLDYLNELEHEKPGVMNDLVFIFDHFENINLNDKESMINMVGSLEKILKEELSTIEARIAKDPNNTYLRQSAYDLYWKMGTIYQEDLNDKAIEYFEHVCEQAEKLVAIEPDRADFRRALVDSYSELAQKYLGMNSVESFIKFSELSEKYILALKAFIEMEPARVDLRQKLATIYHLLAFDVDHRYGVEKANEFKEKSIKEIEDMIQIEPNNMDFKSNLSERLDELAKSYKVIGECTKALKQFAASIGVLKELIALESNSLQYKNRLAMSFRSIGDIHKEMGQFEDALDFYERDLTIRKEFYNSNPDDKILKNSLAFAFENLRDLHKNLGHLDDALDYGQKCLKLKVELSEANPEDETRKIDVDISYLILAVIYTEMGQFEDARHCYEKRLNWRWELYYSNSEDETGKNSLAFVYDSLQNLYKKTGHLQLALDYAQKCLKLQVELSETYPHDETRKFDMVISYTTLAVIHMALGQFEDALYCYERNLTLRKELYNSNPDDETQNNSPASVLDNLQNLFKKVGHREVALDLAQENLTLNLELSEANPQDKTRTNDLAMSYLKLGDIHKKMDQGEDALHSYEKCLALSEELYNSNPCDETLKTSLAFAFESLRDLHKDMGHLKVALDYAQKCLKLKAELNDSNPHDKARMKDLAMSYLVLGDLHNEMGQYAETRHCYEKSNTLLNSVNTKLI